MSSILIQNYLINQKGTPAMYTDIFANRPIYGYTGRLFISTDTKQIFEDTGTSWNLISDAGSGSSNLEQVTTNGNTTDQGISITSGGLIITQSPSYVSGNSISSTLNNITSISINPTGFLIGNYIQNTPTYNSNISIANNYGVYGAYYFLSLVSNGNYTITSSQAAGVRAQSALFAGINTVANGFSATMTHVAGLQIAGVYASGTGTTTITNNYQLLINNSNDYSSASITNSYGIYQNGSGDNNYFAAKVNIGNGNTTFTSFALDVMGTGFFNNGVAIGATNLTGINLNNSLQITGATNAYAFYTNSTIQSGVTGFCGGYTSIINTVAASFTITSIADFYAYQGTIGSGSSITNHYGFYCSSLTGATNNYGFYGAIASASNAWNLYMTGSASNYLNGKLLIGTTTDNSAGVLQVNGAIAPTTNNANAIGSATYQFSNIYSVLGTFSGAVSVGNATNASTNNAVTTKIKLVVSGTTYYLLANTSSS